MKWLDRTFPAAGTDDLPGLLERLRGTPSRLRERLAWMGAAATRRDGERWSAQENAGHLFDLEPLWRGRVDDLREGRPSLRACDPANRRSHEADWNARPLEDLLAVFSEARRELLGLVEGLTPQERARAASHPRLGRPATIADVCLLAAEHDDHHLARITELGRTLGVAPAPATAGWWIEPIVLEGDVVRLEPMRRDHAPALLEAGRDRGIWTWMPLVMDSLAIAEGLVSHVLEWPARHHGQGFVQVDRASGRVAGMTTYLNADERHRRVEIGYTWIAPEFQRTGINTEAKWLLLRHAFEVLGCRRVEWKTDSENARSRAAVARLGALEEGTLRNHMIRPDGTSRHSTYFGVTVEEWPRVDARLREMMRR